MTISRVNIFARFATRTALALVVAGAGGAATIAVPEASMAPAGAAGCNNVEVVFARGTTEAPGIGRVGQAFVNALSNQIGNRSIGAYGVDYPATYDFLAAAQGANDASARIQWLMANCPNTRIVLGGYSQGAAIVDVVSSVPFPAVGFDNPLPPNAVDHIAALAVFGNPTAKVGIPLTASPAYGGRAIDLCNDNDPVCSGGDDLAAHPGYGPGSPQVTQAAAFAAGLL